jgi:arsenate reductase
MSAKLIHNPRCSKSRQALALLEANNIVFDVIEYLKTPLDVGQLDKLLRRLKKEPLEVIRTKESIFKELGLSSHELSREEYLELIAKNPILLERPIFDNGIQAVIGRPPADILSIV